MGRIALVAFVSGTAWVHLLPAVPPAWAALLAGCAGCAGLAWLVRRHAGAPRWARGGLFALAACCAGSSLALARIDLRLQEVLSPDQENLPLPLEYRVTGLAARTDGGQRFEARILAPPEGVPANIQLAWYAPGPGLVAPGLRWRGTVILKRPHGSLNPHGFDYEAYLFEHGIRATGTLRGVPVLLADEPGADAGVLVQRVRHVGRQALQRVLADRRYGPVLVALAIGDQAGVARQDWETFARTGITHLVSISGLHVTMLAALAGWVALLAWKRCRWRGLALAERQPAQVAAAGAALLAAWLYCLLAGWGVPAQRTFFMLGVVALAAMLRLPLSGSRVLAAAGALVCALDPWAPLAPGFWLSFGAVALLIVCGSGRWRFRQDDSRDRPWRTRLASGWREGARAQAALTIGLLPLLALMFQQVSVVAPLANALAIPVVSLLVTPLALAALACCALPGMGWAAAACAAAAHGVFAALMQPVQWLAGLPFAAYELAVPPWWLVAPGLAGALWALQPRGLPGRGWALVLLLPMLVYRPSRPGPGDWRLAMLDVGQGSAIVIETARSVLLYDTGPRYGAAADAGARVVAPYLRARGIRALDELIVTHADADHAGGLESVLAALPARRLRASYSMSPGGPAAQVPFERCTAGQRWVLDGVEFVFLHPRPGAPDAAPRDRNANSCVLRLRGAHHAALLAGDIGIAQERELARRENLAVDVLAAPHHGSRGSSSAELAAASGAAHVVAQAGYLNRYRHPHPDVVKRWERAGSIFHRTDVHGALVFESRAGGLAVAREREARRRYWHWRP
ncbi:ComEC family competence protein [Pigmentiphaga humi]|uniref:ComEC family competence protein n=1 Tax=Pigmentiphaga humi TaxID=2478468 RepID=A0A3P4BAW4_9BURK|nr:DNA internalization-related competence protein ComEC/Rec2 [Pigmentiphaga humi]VCU72275.1 ComEC family competence protein [Pigmentiphaga humi]